LTRLSKWMPPSQFDIAWDSIRDLMLRTPPIEEQRRIADYLDEQILVIDKLVELKQAQVILEKRSKDLIRRNVLLSGIQDFCPLKYITSFTYGDALATEVRVDGVIPVMSSGGVSGSHDTANTMSPAIIIGRKGSFGSVHWTDNPAFVIDTAYFIDQRNTSVNLRWLYHVLQVLDLGELSVDVGIPGLSRDVAYHKLSPLPPSDSGQATVVELLEIELHGVDAHLDLLEKSVSLLRELKTSLITAAVTGQFDVNTGRSVA
jgi:hypothetical protein